MDSPSDQARTVVVRSPTRIDLGGGWTDVPPYCDEQGGFVCNVAIDRYSVATVRASETYRAPDAATAASVTGEQALIAATLRRSGVAGVEISLVNGFPVGSGLGGSSSASAAMLGALARWQGAPWDRAAIAEDGRRIEVAELGIAGGRQDHYAATYGGALALTFTDRVGVRRLTPSSATIASFERRGLLVYTGVSRVSGSTVRAVLDAYRDRDTRVRDALAAMKTLAKDMAVVFEAGDLETLGALLAEHWLHQRSLHTGISTPLIDEIVMRAHAAGALGWKAMGASGGGCVFILSAEDTVASVRDVLAPLGTLVPFALDRDGVHDA